MLLTCHGSPRGCVHSYCPPNFESLCRSQPQPQVQLAAPGGGGGVPALQFAPQWYVPSTVLLYTPPTSRGDRGRERAKGAHARGRARGLAHVRARGRAHVRKGGRRAGGLHDVDLAAHRPARVSNSMWSSWYETRACLNSMSRACGHPGTKQGGGEGAGRASSSSRPRCRAPRMLNTGGP